MGMSMTYHVLAQSLWQPGGTMDPVQQGWEEDVRRQNQATSIQITTEVYDKRLSKYNAWAVNMERCEIPWDAIKQEDSPPRFILRWNRDLVTWECDRVIFPKAITPLTGARQ